MKPSLHRALWRANFRTVPAAERRAARYALQLFRADQRNSLDLSSDGVLAALWQLTIPLLDPKGASGLLERGTPVEGIRRLRFGPRFDKLESEDDDEWDGTEVPDGPAVLRKTAQAVLESLPARVLERLAEADGTDPTTATVANLGQSLGLSPTEIAILDYLEHRELNAPLRQLLRAGQAGSRTRTVGRVNRGRLAALLGVEVVQLQAALAKRAPLRALGLVSCDRDESDLEDFLDPSQLLREVLDTAPQTREELLALLIEPAPAAAGRVEAFPQLADAARRVEGVLQAAARQGAKGINLLFYGPPGTGKTELARALAASAGLQAYQVRSADEDEDGLDRDGRLSAYLLAQRLLARRRDAVVIFDEVEDVFESSDTLLALLSGRSSSGQQKGWMNRILEENAVPAIWITNRTDGMDPAFLRRFLLPVAFVTPPRSVRRQMAESHLRDCAVSSALLDELAADAALAPAQWGAARRLLDLHPDDPAEETIRAGVAAVRTLLHGSPVPLQRKPATAFDAAFLNLAGGLTPSAIARALAASGRGTLCFYGPPGTGKTYFAEILAEALDRELVVRQASDLLAPYVGETEQNLARLFRECDPAHTVLLLDEVDSFLADRRQARHSWERTQVNELLQQMERYTGIFIAATNLMSGIDAAALRRFDFKLQFRPLTPTQRVALFAREVWGDAKTAVPAEYVRHLESLHHLTPGDFATVCRQSQLLGEALTPEQFLRRLISECRLKQAESLQEA